MRLLAQASISSTLTYILLSTHSAQALVAPLQRIAEALHLDSRHEDGSSEPQTSSPVQIPLSVSDEFDLTLQNTTSIQRRQAAAACAGVRCGYYGQLCCGYNSVCYTDYATQAQCTPVGAMATITAGAPGTYTATYVKTDLITYITTYVIPGAVTAVVNTCGSGLSLCGGVCCGSPNYCYNNVCKPLVGFTTEGGVIATAAVRPTTVTGLIITQTVSPTTTQTFIPAESATMSSNGTALPQRSSSGGLSGGAIAGIVIGVLAALALLALICFCCCLKAGLDGILAIFGLGKKKEKKRTYVEEEYVERHRRHGTAAGSAAGRTWYGGASGYSRPSRPPPSRKSSDKKKKLGLLAGLGGLTALFLGKKKHDERKDEKSDVSSGYYDSYYSYDSESSRSRSDYRSPPRRDSRSRRSGSRR